MNMLLNPNTNEIISEDMFQSVANWQTVEFVELTNCEEIETENGFALTGSINGQSFYTEMSQEEYFEGKCFTLVIVNEDVVVADAENTELTEESVKEELETIEGVKITTKNFLRLQHVEINDIRILDYRVDKQNNLIEIFPHCKHFASTAMKVLSINEFINLVRGETNDESFKFR